MSVFFSAPFVAHDTQVAAKKDTVAKSLAEVFAAAARE